MIVGSEIRDRPDPHGHVRREQQRAPFGLDLPARDDRGQERQFVQRVEGDPEGLEVEAVGTLEEVQGRSWPAPTIRARPGAPLSTSLAG